MLSRLLIILVSLWPLSLIASAQSPASPAAQKKVLVESVVISGTLSLTSLELAKITDSLAGGRFNDDPDELSDRLRAKFSDRGYMKAQVEKLDIKVLDPVANPKPVRLEAVVTEGPLCHFSGVEFTGNHAINSDDLRAAFPIKNGQNFHRSSIASGLETMRTLYGSCGFLDMTSIPNARIDSDFGVKLLLDVDEGPQYRMGKFEVIGAEGASESLRMRWELMEGTVYDVGYLEKFLEKNHSLFPADITPAEVILLRDCPNATVSIHLHLKHDLQHEISDQAKQVACEYSNDRTE